MILSKTVNIKISNPILNFYKNKGFNNIKVGDIIKVPIKLLPIYSRTIIKVKCDYCGKENEIYYNSYSLNTDKETTKYACSFECIKLKKLKLV